MNEPQSHITSVQLHASRDLGHGGTASTYQIEPDSEGYRVTLTISRSTPAPGERDFQPSRTAQTLGKDKLQVEAFLRRLSSEFNVYELGDLKPPYPFLHATFYSFIFHHAAGHPHSFNYAIEGDHHLDARYQGLVEAFQSFFQSHKKD